MDCQKKSTTNKSPCPNRRGITTVMALFVMLVLITLALVVASILANEGKILVDQTYGQAAYFLADAGIEIGIRAIRDDVTETTRYGTGDLRPGTIQGTAGSGTLTERQEQMNRVRYYNEPADEAVTLSAEGTDGTYVVARDFDQTYAGLGCLIKDDPSAVVEIGCRYKLSSAPAGGTYPTLTIDYTVDGTFTDAAGTTYSASVDSDSYNTTLIVLDISGGRTPWTWDDLMAIGTDHSTNFAVRATASGSAEYKVDIDCIFLRVSYEIDHHDENWFSDWSNSDETPKVVDIPLGRPAGADADNSIIHTLSILDEDGKINLNYANRDLMKALFYNCSLESSRAANIADAIIAYRTATGLFRLPKEIYQIDLSPYDALSESEYNSIKDYCTLFSGVNKFSRRPDGVRASVNINTASDIVLKSVLQMVPSCEEVHIDSLVADIIARRATAPFTAFYSVDPGITTDFYDFIIVDETYLSSDEQTAILNNASPSLLVPVYGSTDSGCISANFSYSSNAFTIDCLAKKDPAQRRVKVIGFDDGTVGPIIE